MTRPGQTIGWFRTIKDPNAAKRAMGKHPLFFKSDERCRHEVKKKHVRGPCGAGCTMCVANVWYCTRHGKMMEAKLAAEAQQPNSEPQEHGI